MGNLKFGTYTPTALYMGASGATKAYYGTTEVFSGGTPIDYQQEYLTFDILTGGTVDWKAVTSAITGTTISYSKNNGTWTEIEATTGGTSINVEAGDKLRFQGNTNGTGAADTGNFASFRGGTATFNISGNIMSIAKSTDFANYTLPSVGRSFKGLFGNSNVVSAEHLWIPSATTVQFEFRSLFLGCSLLTTAPQENTVGSTHTLGWGTSFVDCTSLTVPPKFNTLRGSRIYEEMFRGCTSLTTAPELPMDNIATQAYRKMFSGCTSLNYVKCLASTGANSTNLESWLDGVAATGTFIKKAGVVYPSGKSGIPTGWTVYSYDAPMVSPSEIIVDSDSLTAVTIQVASLTPYTIATNESWITLPTTASTSGTSVYTISLDAKEYGPKRTGSISFIADATITVPVTQGQYYGPVLLSTDNIVLSATTATAITIQATSSNNYTITTDAEWITLPASSGTSGVSTYTIDIAASSGQRRGTITFENAQGTSVFSVWQGYNMEEEYLTFEIVSGGTILWKTEGDVTNPLTIEYSINGGSWTSITADATGQTINVSSGDIVKFRGDTQGTGEYDDQQRQHLLGTGTATFIAYGNVMSLVSSTNFSTATLGSNRTFRRLFAESNMISGEYIYLPPALTNRFQYRSMFEGSTSLVTPPLITSISELTFMGCATMFQGCTSLTQGIVISATSLSNARNLESIYNGCSSLSYVKVLTNTTYSPTNWLKDVAATGTFVKKSTAGWSAGNYGIPIGWTVVDAS